MSLSIRLRSLERHQRSGLVQYRLYWDDGSSTGSDEPDLPKDDWEPCAEHGGACYVGWRTGLHVIRLSWENGR